MASQTLFEKLQLKDEKSILIQGIPSSLESYFSKLSFSKNVTPLLKSKKIDFALIFAFNQKQLIEILNDVVPALQETFKFWIAYPKLSAKIVSDLSRDTNWFFLEKYGLQVVRSIAVDNTWSGLRLKKKIEINIDSKNFCSTNPAPGVDYKNKIVKVPIDLQMAFDKNKQAQLFFETLAFSHKREYVEWILSAKKEETKLKRIDTTIQKLNSKKKNYNDK